MSKYRILLVEDSKVFTRLAISLLEISEDYEFEIKSTSTLEKTKKQLEKEYFDAVILDLTLPDSEPEETFEIVHDLIPETAIIVSTSSTNKLALNALRHGAQDYLPKSGINSQIICNAIAYGIERQKILLQRTEYETILKRRILKLSEQLEKAELELEKYRDKEFTEEHDTTKLKTSYRNISKDELGSVLLVDDIDINLKVSTCVLNSCGISDIVYAKNGQEAVETWKKHKNKLIIMDIHMPIMDGVTATTRIRQEGNSEEQPYIVALSAAVSESLVVTCSESGMDSVVSKPLNPQKLNEICNKLLS